MKFLLSLLFLLFTLLSIVIYIYLTTEIKVPSFGDEDNTSQHDKNTTDPKKIEEGFLKEHFVANWDDIHDQLDEAIEKYKEIDEAGEPSFFWDKRASLWEELYVIFDEIIEEIRNEHLDEHKEHIEEIKEGIQGDIETIKELEESLKEAPKESYIRTTVDGYKKKIKAIEGEIKTKKKSIEEIENQIYAYYYVLGIKLPSQKINLLTQRIDFNYLYESALAMNMLQKAMRKVKKETMESKYDFNKTLYYYNTSRIAFEFIIYLQKRHRTMIDEHYIPTLNSLLEETTASYKEDRQKQQRAKSSKEFYVDNLKALLLFISASKLYKKDLLKQRQALWKVHLLANKHLQRAQSRYTRSIQSLEVLKPKCDMQTILDKIIQYYFDDMGIFIKNKSMKKKYIEITTKLAPN